MAKTNNKKRSKKGPNIEKVVTQKSKDVPVTKAMFFELRSELKHDLLLNNQEIKSVRKEVQALDLKMESRFKEVEARFTSNDSRFTSIDARFDQVDARFEQVDARFDHMDSKFEEVLSEVRRIGLLVENQNSNNIYVLDKLTHVNDRHEQITDGLREEIDDIKHVISLVPPKDEDS